MTKQLQAVGARDEPSYASAYRDDAVLRTAGVPRSLGGVIEGRAAIVESFQNQAHHRLDVRQIFAEGDAVCAVAKRSSHLAGTE